MSLRTTQTIRVAFNAGEWSPLMDARLDLDKSLLAARTMKNAMIDTQGRATRRPGLHGVYGCDGRTVALVKNSPGFPSRRWEGFSQDYEVAAEFAYEATGWESFDEVAP
jgi:hypothetical protein